MIASIRPLVLGAAGLALLCTAPGATAQTPAPAPTISEWRKLCADPPKTECVVGSAARLSSGSPVMELTQIEPGGGKPRTFGVVIFNDAADRNSKVRLSVDGKRMRNLPIKACNPQAKACLAEATISAGFAAELKAGRELVVDIGGPTPTRLTFPLAGYVGAAASKGLTVSEARAVQAQMLKEMEERAAAARRQFQPIDPKQP